MTVSQCRTLAPAPWREELLRKPITSLRSRHTVGELSRRLARDLGGGKPAGCPGDQLCLRPIAQEPKMGRLSLRCYLTQSASGDDHRQGRGDWRGGLKKEPPISFVPSRSQ